MEISGFTCAFKETLTNKVLTSISFKAKTRIKLQSMKNEMDFFPVFVCILTHFSTFTKKPHLSVITFQ